MTFFKNALFSLALTVIGVSQAHEGHDHDMKPITEQQASALGDKALAALVTNKEIPASWQGQKKQSTKLKKVNGAKVWVVAYKNPNGKAPNEQSLYLVFDDIGNYIESTTSDQFGK